MHLYVFLKNKLISADAIVPLLVELKRHEPKLRVQFFVLHPATETALRQNVVLWEAMATLGTVHLITRRERSWAGWLEHRLASAVRLPQIAAMLAMRRARLLHFGNLAGSPLGFLLHCARDGDLLVDAAFASFTTLQTRFANLRRTRETKPDANTAPRVLAFDPGSPLYRDAQSRGATAFLAGPPHLMPAWVDFVADRADAFLDAELGASRDRAQPLIAFMLGYFGALDFMRKPDSLPQLFDETLDLLLEACPDVPILIKPHVISDMRIVDEALRRRANPRLKITHLHPSVLVTRAAFFIANYYSTTLSTASALGCPTIEYTDYSDDALAVSEGGSIRPDSVTHFIQHDAKQLATTARVLATERRPPVPSQGRWVLDPSLVSFLRAA